MFFNDKYLYLDSECELKQNARVTVPGQLISFTQTADDEFVYL